LIINRSKANHMISHDDRCKWVALSNTTLGMLIATINSSIVLISLPAIFNGVGLNPLQPGNVCYLLWMLMGYMLVTAVLVVTLGRLGDIYGRVRIYNVGFAIFAVTSVILSLDPFTGGKGALWLIGWRVIQAIGGAMLMANSAAIITDAFPAAQRGMALGINIVAAIAGSFIGLVLGGLLAEWHWRSIFWVNVPIGLVGTVWAYRSLRDNGARRPGKIDRPRRPAVHAHHLASGHLAAIAWIQRSSHPAVGGHLPAAANRRLPRRRSAVRPALRSLWRPALRRAGLPERLRWGLFSAPNTALIMSSVPAHLRGVASGMRATFQNAGMVLSIGIFFSLMVAGLSHSLPSALDAGLTAQGVPAQAAHAISVLPPVGTLFAPFLGYNPIRELLGPQALGRLPAANAAALTDRQFFPHLIAGPFHDGLVIVFWLAIIMGVLGAAASLISPRKSPTLAEDLVTKESELIDEFYGARPLTPAPRAAEPLDRE
jgi:MFS family permease